MEQSSISEQRVKAANQQFYDTVVSRYEAIDGRRSPLLEAWLHQKLSRIRQQTPGGHLLDIGTGGGLVTRCAKGLFTSRVGIDLSTKMLAANQTAFDWGITADVDYLPFGDECFDVVTCFAVLHHLYRFEGLVSEVTRVLRMGGIFYSDHDMDATFSKRFHPFLFLYRNLCNNARAKYSQAGKGITRELYDLTEWQEKGVDSFYFVRLLQEAGFSIEARFHWFGLIPIMDKLLGRRTYPRGWAPLLSVVAVKEKKGED